MEWQTERVDSCQSTQDEIRVRARDGAPDGTVVVATVQEAGHGRHGRSWHSPEGGLYLSFLLRDVGDPRFLTLAMGCAVADALETAGAEPELKWVNDVMVEGRKVAGVLAEAESTGESIDFLACGLGINVNGDAQTWPHPLDRQAITLEQVLGAESCIEDLEPVLFDALGHWIERVRTGRSREVLQAFARRDFLNGRLVGFDPDGDLDPKLHGAARGVDDQGRLLLEVDGELQAHANGSVVLQE